MRLKSFERGPRRYAPGGWREDTLPVNVFAIRHPRGLCLFDAGQTARAADRGYFPAWHPFFRLARFELGADDEAHTSLRRLGLDPGELRWIVLSHLHTDHAGGLASLTGRVGDCAGGAQVFVSRTEWERAAGLAGRVRGYLPQHWPTGLRPRLVDFDGPAVGPFAGSFDLAGDGNLVVVPTPGHTPGHMSLLVRGADSSYLCAGDLSESAARLHETAPTLAAFCREEGIVVLATHDPEAQALLGNGRR